MTRMQEESASVYVIEDTAVILGLITLEDILEQVVGQLEDEDYHTKPLLLTDALTLGGMVTAMQASSRDEAIHELVAAVPVNRLPAVIDAAQLAALVFDREEEISTDLGNGVAIPHARCPGLGAPLVAMDRSRKGIFYSTQDVELVRLFFLLVTPAERSESQLSLLRQVARLADTEAARDSLMKANSPTELLDLIYNFQPQRAS